MDAQISNHPLARENLGRLIARFSLPSVVSMLVSALYNIVDQVFIGHRLGPVGNAATNVDFPLALLALSLGLLFGIGGAANISLALGAGEKERAARTAGCAVFWLAVSGVALAAVARVFLEPILVLFGATDTVLPLATAYTGITSLGLPFAILASGVSALLRADGRPGCSMLCMVVGCVTNASLDAVLMFGFGLGIEGAAWATVVGQFISCAMALCFLRRCRMLRLTKDCFKPRRTVTLSILALGVASCFNQLAMAVVQVATNQALRRYGAQSPFGGETALACAGIVSKVNMVFLSVVIGVAQGCQPILGFNYGAKNYPRVRQTYRRALTLALVFSTAGFLCFQLFPRFLIGLFGGGDAAYFTFAERYFRVFLLCAFLNGIQPVTANFFTAIGKAFKGLFISLTRQILFLLPLVIVLPLFFGIDGILYAGPVADAAMAALAMALITSEMRGLRRLEGPA
ncbi:MAG: MATE family efflux transporter [Oscillospiraceae bacterium]|jgi:putative MATE family efflux protein|nr:MATE family efflux transporter [Oscillospiraceae bacterium]